MGDYPTKQSELITRNHLGHNNVEIREEEFTALSYSDSYSYYRNSSEVSSRYHFSDAVNGMNGTRNVNKDYGMKHLPNSYEFNEQLNQYSDEYSDDITMSNGCPFTANLASNDLVNKQGKFNSLQQAPYVLTVLPQKINKLGPQQIPSSGQPAFYSQVPITFAEPVYYHNASQRAQYFRPVQPIRNIEFSWYKGKMTPIHSQEGAGPRSFGPIGAEVAGLRCGVPVRNFPSHVNMVRIFPENRLHVSNTQDNNNNYFLTQKRTEILRNFNKCYSDINEENFESKSYKYYDNDKKEKKSKNTFVSSSVHLGGLLTIPRGIEHALDNSSQSSSNTSDNSINPKLMNSTAIFKETATYGCNEIQKLIKQYNIKSPTVNIENFCKSVNRQINNSKNIMQMEPIMREMILGYLYLSNSWTSLASVLAVQREQTPPLDSSLESLKSEFLTWQRKSKVMLEQIIISLKKIPQEHEKYIASIYKTSSSSSENSTAFTDENFTDSESDVQDHYRTAAWNNDQCYDNYSSTKYCTSSQHNRERTNSFNKTPGNDSNKTNYYDSITESKLYNSINHNEKNQSSNSHSGTGKKNYSSNRPPARNKYNTVAKSPRNDIRK